MPFLKLSLKRVVLVVIITVQIVIVIKFIKQKPQNAAKNVKDSNEVEVDSDQRRLLHERIGLKEGRFLEGKEFVCDRSVSYPVSNHGFWDIFRGTRNEESFIVFPFIG